MTVSMKLSNGVWHMPYGCVGACLCTCKFALMICSKLVGPDSLVVCSFCLYAPITPSTPRTFQKINFDTLSLVACAVLTHRCDGNNAKNSVRVSI